MNIHGHATYWADISGSGNLGALYGRTGRMPMGSALDQFVHCPHNFVPGGGRRSVDADFGHLASRGWIA